MKLVERQLHEVSMKIKLQFYLIIKEMKLEDQKAIIKTKDNLGKEQKKGGGDNERKERVRIKKVRNKNVANEISCFTTLLTAQIITVSNDKSTKEYGALLQ